MYAVEELPKNDQQPTRDRLKPGVRTASKRSAGAWRFPRSDAHRLQCPTGPMVQHLVEFPIQVPVDA